MAKIYQVAVEIKTKPDSTTMKKMGKQLEQVVEKSFSTPFQAGSRVLRSLSAGLKKGIRGAIEGAFKMSGSVMGFFKGVSSAIEEPLNRIKEVLQMYEDIDNTALNLGITKNQALHLKDFAAISGGKPEHLFQLADKILTDLSDEQHSILAQHGLPKSRLEQHGKDNLSLLMSFLQIMGAQTEEQQRYFSQQFFGGREFAKIKPFFKDMDEMKAIRETIKEKIIKPGGDPLVSGSLQEQNLVHLNQEAIIQERIESRQMIGVVGQSRNQHNRNSRD